MRFIGIIAVALLAPSTRADLINGNFENGLTGWTVDSGTWAAPVDNTGNHWAATLTGGLLWQSFTLPAGAQALSLRYGYGQSGPGGGSGWPDHINFYLLDAVSNANLIPPLPGEESAAAYLGQDWRGLYAVNPAYVTVTPPDADEIRHVTVSLTHVPAGQEVLVAFGSFEYAGDGRDSYLMVDDVSVTVPEPATLLMAALGAAALRRARRPGRPC
jgi:hypothetical protein